MLNIFIIAALLMLPVTAIASTIQIPRTGQSKCFDTDGFELTCDGTGQDADIKSGVMWINPRFNDNGNQTVTDNVTGLIWTKDVNLMKTRNPTFDTDYTPGDGKVYLIIALNYIKKLNTESYLGFNDWRLPNINELESIFNKQQSNNAGWLNTQGFINCQADQYWTSTSFIPDTTYALTVNIDNGDVAGRLRSSSRNVWPVRGGLLANGTSSVNLPSTRQTTCYQNSTDDLASLYPAPLISCVGSGQDGELQVGAAWPIPRFLDNGDQTISDNLTGLMWMKDADLPYLPACGSFSTLTWQGALNFVKCFNQNAYLNKTDWRLPNVNELESIVHHSQSNISGWLISQGFLSVNTSYYWSSTSSMASPNQAKAVSFYSGISSSFDKTASYYAWFVRGGVLAINGTCGTSNHQAFATAPKDNFCSAGTASTLSGSGPWNWTCNGSNGGTTAICKAYTSSQLVPLAVNNFDTVTTPALPLGWVSNNTGATWATNTGTRYPSGIAAHSPTKLVFFNSFTAGSGSTASLISPAFSLSNVVNGKLTFWMYRDTGYPTLPDLIGIYVNTSASLSGASLLGTINRSTTLPPTVASAGWYQYSYDIPATYKGNSNYLIINGVSGFGNDIHIDDINLYAIIAPPTLNVSITGSGSVHSSPMNDIACINGSNVACSGIFDHAVEVTLTAYPEITSSTFTGWDVPGCTTATCILVMDTDKSVMATFSLAPRSKIAIDAPTGYDTLIDAYNNASSSIFSMNSEFTGDWTLDGSKDIFLIGGYQADYNSRTGFTTQIGKLTIKGGSLRVDGFKIR